MIKKIKTGKYDSSFAVNDEKKFYWFNGAPLNYTLIGDIPRTQDLMPVVAETSSLYIFSKDMFKNHSRRIGFNPYLKPVGIIESWDIDTQEDFTVAQALSEINNDISS